MPTPAQIVFTVTMDGKLQLGIHYHYLNQATMQNQYPMPLTLEMLNGLWEAQISMKQANHNDIYLTQIEKSNENKTAMHR